MQLKVHKHTLVFKQPSGTSRGILRTKDSWFIAATQEDDLIGVGECSIIEGLSPEDPVQMDIRIDRSLEQLQSLDPFSIPPKWPSIKFGLEMLSLSTERVDPFNLFDSEFTSGSKGIPINGLIWMGDKQFMFDQIRMKIKEGFSCLKLKIGAINFEEEIDLLRYVRSQFGPDDIELRVDANGAFSSTNALEKLKTLSQFQLHSIEQPIKQGQRQEMSRLCELTPLPIALDEELSGINERVEKVKLLDQVKPHYLVLKPSLIGGFRSSDEWIELTANRDIGWWATSALEANVGLNAIAQWVAQKDYNMPQGLGTGSLYTNNVNSPLTVLNAKLWYEPENEWDHSFFKFLKD